MITGVILLVAFIWAVGSVYYQMVVRTFAQDAIRFNLFALRDDLRSKALSGEVDAQSFAFQHLEDMLNKMVHMCKWYGFSTLLEFMIREKESVRHPDFDRFDAEANEYLKSIEQQALHQMMLVMTANSPWWFAVCSLVAILGVVATKCNPRVWVTSANRVIWHDYGSLTPA